MSDIEIARKARLLPISQIGEKLSIPEKNLIQFGSNKAKISNDHLESIAGNQNGKLILVTAITPTPAGEGKTTTSVGLNDGLNKLGKKSVVCLREPSLGPCFGMKGGAAGGGYAQVVPMEDINLHFTGDFHAIGAAHNLLSALIDNHVHWGNELGIDVRRMQWKRVIDMNDRALRSITCGLGGPGNGFPRQDGYDITVASEVMAIFCLSNNLGDLKSRLEKIVIGYTRENKPIFASQIKGIGAMATLLRDALAPNLVQTLENNPAIIHGGPFANIAHGCNSVIATKSALKMADYVVTEAGFGADLGAEKFFNIKCRSAGISPDVAVIVATIRALKMHGGVDKDNLSKENVTAVSQGGNNLARHIENVKSFGVPVIVAINRFVTDTDAEIQSVKDIAIANGVKAIECTHWSDGGNGTIELAEEVVSLVSSGAASFAPLYPNEMGIWDKIKTVATRLYRADDVIADKKVRAQIRKFEEDGYGELPICVAKTQYSFSTDPNLKGAPNNHVMAIREVRLSAGAGFIVVVCGDIMTMPGLPRVPAANIIDVNNIGEISGLF
ncbi:formate--tetrahydrofolate ligase [Gammaproteobacteria bacterium]|nr:formate--tetrahydrofolate ligase [Gammaproteobacteria bacterium]